LLLEASAVYLPSCPQCLIEKSCGCGGGTVCACRSTVRILTSEQVTQRNLVMQAAITRARVPTIAPLPPLQAQQHDSALKGWLGLKSDQHPSMYCPKGRECPSKAAQLATCPATDCPLQRNAAETMFDIDLDDTHHRSILTAAAKDIARDAGVQLAREVSHDLGQEMRRVLQHHRMMTTGRID